MPDELFAIRKEIGRLEDREAELRRLLLANPDLREGASYFAEVRTTKQRRTDWKELRAMHPDIVDEHTYPVTVQSVVILGITEDGELVNPRKLKAAP